MNFKFRGNFKFAFSESSPCASLEAGASSRFEAMASNDVLTAAPWRDATLPYDAALVSRAASALAAADARATAASLDESGFLDRFLWPHFHAGVGVEHVLTMVHVRAEVARATPRTHTRLTR